MSGINFSRSRSAYNPYRKSGSSWLNGKPYTEYMKDPGKTWFIQKTRKKTVLCYGVPKSFHGKPELVSLPKIKPTYSEVFLLFGKPKRADMMSVKKKKVIPKRQSTAIKLSMRNAESKFGRKHLTGATPKLTVRARKPIFGPSVTKKLNGPKRTASNPKKLKKTAKKENTKTSAPSTTRQAKKYSLTSKPRYKFCKPTKNLLKPAKKSVKPALTLLKPKNRDSKVKLMIVKKYKADTTRKPIKKAGKSKK